MTGRWTGSGVQTDMRNRLYERAEDACAEGLELHAAIQAVLDGYSSAEMDAQIEREERARGE